VQTYLNLAQIVVAIAMTAVIMLQTKGAALGGVFGRSDSAVYKTRRGLEKTVFNVTIGLSFAFFIMAVLNVILLTPQK
jgi:preprotein translocase subunit SecG